MAAAPWLPELLRARGPRRVAFALATVVAVLSAGLAAYVALRGEARRTSPGADAHRPGPAAGARSLCAAARCSRCFASAMRWLAWLRCAGRGAGSHRLVCLSAHRCRPARARASCDARGARGRHRRNRLRGPAQGAVPACSPGGRASNFGQAAGAIASARQRTPRVARGEPGPSAVIDTEAREMCFAGPPAEPTRCLATGDQWFLVTRACRTRAVWREATLRRARRTCHQMVIKYRWLACIPDRLCQNAAQALAQERCGFCGSVPMGASQGAKLSERRHRGLPGTRWPLPALRAETTRKAPISLPLSASSVRRPPAVGLDVLATKVAVDFQGLTSEGGDSCIKRNLDALREATGSTRSASRCSTPRRTIIERVASCDRRCSRRSTRRC